MAKATFNLVKDVWTLVATGACVVTVVRQGSASIFFNDQASETNAFGFSAQQEHQFLQNNLQDTYVKARGDDWIIVIDGVL